MGLALMLVVAGAQIAGCASRFDREYAGAEHWRQGAADAGYEWIDTGTLLAESRQAYDAGDTELAFRLLDKARFQAEAAVRQAEREAEDWQGRVIR